MSPNSHHLPSINNSNYYSPFWYNPKLTQGLKLHSIQNIKNHIVQQADNIRRLANFMEKQQKKELEQRKQYLSIELERLELENKYRQQEFLKMMSKYKEKIEIPPLSNDTLFWFVISRTRTSQKRKK